MPKLSRLIRAAPGLSAVNAVDLGFCGQHAKAAGVFVNVSRGKQSLLMVILAKRYIVFDSYLLLLFEPLSRPVV